jgi:pyruvate/2-oxoglutarate/acetoin dehydrogenase E1 component
VASNSHVDHGFNCNPFQRLNPAIRRYGAGIAAGEGIEAEVIDVATLKPLDTDTILGSVERTGRCIIVHESALTGGVGAEIAAHLADEGLTLMARRRGKRHQATNCST